MVIREVLNMLPILDISFKTLTRLYFYDCDNDEMVLTHSKLESLLTKGQSIVISELLR